MNKDFSAQRSDGLVEIREAYKVLDGVRKSNNLFLLAQVKELIDMELKE